MIGNLCSAHHNKLRLQVLIEDIKTSLISKFQSAQANQKLWPNDQIAIVVGVAFTLVGDSWPIAVGVSL